MTKKFLILFLICGYLQVSSQNLAKTCIPLFNKNLMGYEINQKSLSESEISFQADENYTADFDSLEFYQGRQSILVTGLTNNVNSFATTSIKIPITVASNSNMVVSVRIKVDSLYGENSGAMLRLSGYNDKKTLKPPLFVFSDTILKGNSDWTKVSISTTTKEKLNNIVISGLMQGKGLARYDDLEITIDNKKLENLSFYSSKIIEEKTFENLKNYTTPLQDEKMDAVGDYIINQYPHYKIIGIGEATHGTKENFKIKSEIIKSLVLKNELKTIALEAYYANTQILNDYVQGKAESLKRILAQIGFWPYYNQEFFIFIDWIRNYNSNNKEKISIIGVDPQSGEKSLEKLSLEINDDKGKEILNKLNDDKITLNKKFAISEELQRHVQTENFSQDLILNSKILNQSYYLNQFQGLEYSSVRDSIMALNIDIISQNLSDGEKIAFWAHDLHVQKKPGWSGGYLKEIFDEKYINIGFLLNEGKYTAVDQDTKNLASDNKLTMLTCNSLEYQMRKFEHPLLMFKFDIASENIFLQEHLFKNSLAKRSIGALETRDQLISLGEIQNIFNVMIYIDKSNPTRILN